VSKDYGVHWPDWNANLRATFILDKEGKVRFTERYAKGELPDPDKILAEVKKIG
jgi:alkyl hydroperoxide reductase subunit AhpC